jgi:16S rRNA (guanine527-N7)-methyltransferase
MIDRNRLQQKCAAKQIALTEAQLDQLDRYAEFLVSYNEKVNLTAITDPEGIEDKHFVDSLLFAVRPEVAGSLIDVGTGAGFPGIVAKIYKPELKLTLMEPTGKRVTFLQQACELLGLNDVEIVKERAEEAARKQWREKFDVAAARAVAALPVLAEYCLPLVKRGGVFVAMKGASGEEELAQARGALHKLGGGEPSLTVCTLPGGDERTLIICKKISQTPPQYPRNGGKIAKSPLK